MAASSSGRATASSQPVISRKLNGLRINGAGIPFRPGAHVGCVGVPRHQGDATAESRPAVGHGEVEGESGHRGQADVQEDREGRLRPQQLVGHIRAAGAQDPVSEVAEHAFQRASKYGVVVDDEDGAQGGDHGSPQWVQRAREASERGHAGGGSGLVVRLVFKDAPPGGRRDTHNTNPSRRQHFAGGGFVFGDAR